MSQGCEVSSAPPSVARGGSRVLRPWPVSYQVADLIRETHEVCAKGGVHPGPQVGEGDDPGLDARCRCHHAQAEAEAQG